MRFDVVKATEHFSKDVENEERRTLQFEVVPGDGAQLDFGEHHVLIGSGYHAFKGEGRRPVIATVSVFTDAGLDRIAGEKPICGVAFFYPELEVGYDPTPAILSINIEAGPDMFEAMVRTGIKEPGAATLNVGIHGLDFGPAPDGSHQIWNLDDDSDCGRGTMRRVIEFELNVDKFWSSEGAISDAKDKQLNAQLADSPDPEDRKLAALSQPEGSDVVASLLRQCRVLLIALLVLGIAAFLKFA
jgi:hypothetical protein